MEYQEYIDRFHHLTMIAVWGMVAGFWIREWLTSKKIKLEKEAEQELINSKRRLLAKGHTEIDLNLIDAAMWYAVENKDFEILKMKVILFVASQVATRNIGKETKKRTGLGLVK